jgi:hypothetical protein
MARIPVFGPGLRASSPYITAKGMRNCYAEPRPEGEKASIVGLGRWGKTLFTDFGATPARGGRWLITGSLAYVVHRAVLWSVNNAGVKTNLGMLNTTSGRVSMTDNGTQLMIVDGTNGYIYSTVPIAGTPQTISSITIDSTGTIATVTTAAPHLLTTGNLVSLAGQNPTAYSGNYTVTVTGASTFTFVMDVNPGGNASGVGTYTIVSFAQITSPSFPANPTTCTFLHESFWIQSANSRRFYGSGQADGLSGYALNFASAEDQPDPMQAIWTSNGQLFLMCAAHMEFWGASGGQDFLVSEVQGTTSEWGLAATWSVARFAQTVACLIKNRTNQVSIANIAGYLPVPLSTPDLDKIINGYANTADASAYSFMLGGHPMYVINFPSAGASWLYDGLAKQWSQINSDGLTRDSADFSFNFLNDTILSDYSTGKLYRLDPNAVTDNGSAINVQITTETIADPDLNRLTVNRLRIDVAVGGGNANDPGSDPQIGLEVSRDNGETWGAQMMRSLGKLGNYRKTVEWDMLGTARNFVFRLSMSDPVKFTLISACVNPEN